MLWTSTNPAAASTVSRPSSSRPTSTVMATSTASSSASPPTPTARRSTETTGGSATVRRSSSRTPPRRTPAAPVPITTARSTSGAPTSRTRRSSSPAGRWAQAPRGTARSAASRSASSRYYFVKSANAVSLTQTVYQLAGRPLRRPAPRATTCSCRDGGVRVYHRCRATATDVNPAGGVYFDNKAAGYFPAPLALRRRRTSRFAWTRSTTTPGRPGPERPAGHRTSTTTAPPTASWSARPSTAATGGSPAAPRRSSRPAPRSTVAASAPTTTAPCPSGAAAFPNAKILHVGWSLGSGAVGDGVINAITVGLTKYTFSGLNRRPGRPQPGGDHPGRHQRPGDADRDRPRR